jgi:CRP-like cAMP-binding protein
MDWGHVWPGAHFTARLPEGHPLREFDAARRIWDFLIQPRSASVRARTELSVLSMSNTDMHTLYKESPHAFVMIVMNIAREISRRLRKMNRLVASSVYSPDRAGPAGP